MNTTTTSRYMTTPNGTRREAKVGPLKGRALALAEDLGLANNFVLIGRQVIPLTDGGELLQVFAVTTSFVAENAAARGWEVKKGWDGTYRFEREVSTD